MDFEASSLGATNLEVIAEVGINHNGSLDLAKSLVESAAKAGATVVKFQTYRTNERVQEGHPLESILKECELTQEDFSILKEHCSGWGVKFLSTVFGLSSLATLAELEVDTCKIASFSLTDEALIKAAIDHGMTLIVSTGASSLDEVQKTNSWLEKSNRGHKFMHCISKYPVIEESDLNLSNIREIAELTGREVGFSDHSIGTDAGLFAAIAGARIFEKHFTTDNSLPGPDQKMSANPGVFRDYIDKITRGREIWGIPRSSIYHFELPIQQFRTNSVQKS